MLTHQPPELLQDGRMSPAVDVYRCSRNSFTSEECSADLHCWLTLQLILLQQLLGTGLFPGIGSMQALRVGQTSAERPAISLAAMLICSVPNHLVLTSACFSLLLQLWHHDV